MGSVVSIVIPTYNRLWGLKDCIASIKAQDFVDWEVIVMDDAGTEPVGEYVASLQDPRVHYFRQEVNVGVARNWADGILKVKSPYLCILMDDDWYESKFLSSRLNIFRKYSDVGMVYGSYSRINTVSGTIDQINTREKGSIGHGSLIKAMLGGDCFIGTAMHRTKSVQSIIEEAVFFGLILDYPINLLTVLRCPLNGFALDNFDFNYRNHPETISNTRRELANLQCYRFLQRAIFLDDAFEMLRKQEICDRAMTYSMNASNWFRRIEWACRSIYNQPFQFKTYKCLAKRLLLR